jgi:DNA-binding HxlR family transcriptional regulator
VTPSRPSTRSYGDPCGVARSLDVVGERWALLVVRELLLGPKRFSDLLAGLAGASPNVVSQRLRDLAEHGVVRRRDAGPPARVHVYELTAWGRQLEPVILSLGRWGSRAPQPDTPRRLGIDSVVLSLEAAFDPSLAKTGNASYTYELRIDEEVFVLELVDGALHARRGAAHEPDATIVTNRERLTALVEGRRALDDLLDVGDLRITGDRKAHDLAIASFLAPAMGGG